MFLEKHLVLLVHVMCFLCAHCNDDTFTWRETKITEPMESIYDTTENLTCCDSTTMAGLTSQDPGSTDGSTTYYENFVTTITYESTVEDERLTTDSQTDSTIDETSFFSTIYYSTQTAKTTVSVDTTSISTEDPICDSSWPINPTEDTMEVINLKDNGIGTEWIALSWESPCTVPPNVSITYSVERCDDEKNCNQTNERDTQHNATDLDACTQYTFTVKIITEYWQSDGTDLQLKTDYNISEIGNVRLLSDGAVGIHAIELTWLAPEKYTRCITNYSIAQCIEQSCNETVVPVANYTANNLEQCTYYNFTVKTVTQTVQSVGANRIVKTASPMLPEPQSLKITPSNFSLYVEWEPSQSDLTCLKHYRVIITPEDYNSTTPDTNVTLTNLYACTKYSVSVNAVNKDDQNGPAISRTEETTIAKTEPPTLHSEFLATRYSVLLIVSITKQNNRCPLNKLVTTCNHTWSNGTGFEPSNGYSLIDFDKNCTEESLIVKNVTVQDLNPFTEYTCDAYTIIGDQYSEHSDKVTAQTHEDVPSPPSFAIKNITESQFSVVWEQPDYLAGIVKDYKISLEWKPLFPIPTWCSLELPNNTEIKNLNDTQSYDYCKAKAYSQYQVKMQARTGAGWGNFSAIQTIQSNSAIPDAVSKFTCTIQENPNDVNTLDTIVTWGIPCSLNGKLDVYNVSVHGTRDGYDNHTFSQVEECTDYLANDYMCSVNLKELKGEYNYTFSVYPKILHVDMPGPVKNQSGIIYPPGIPPLPDDEDARLITIDPFKAIKTTTTAAVLLPLFPDTNGNIKYYAIMVSEFGRNTQTSMRYDLKNKPWPNVSSWKEAMMNDFSITYQATLPKWNPYPNSVVDYGHIKVVKFVIGADTLCKDISLNVVNQPVYCNGPLKPDTWYHIRMRAFTEGGYADSQLFVVKTNAELNVAIVIGVVFGILFLGILTTMMLLVRKCSPRADYS